MSFDIEMLVVLFTDLDGKRCVCVCKMWKGMCNWINRECVVVSKMQKLNFSEGESAIAKKRNLGL